MVHSITQDDSAVKKEDTMETETEASMYSLKKQLYGLANTKAVFARDGVLSRETEKLYLDCKRVSRLEKKAGMRQMSISDPFKYIPRWSHNPVVCLPLFAPIVFDDYQNPL